MLFGREMGSYFISNAAILKQCAHPCPIEAVYKELKMNLDPVSFMGEAWIRLSPQPNHYSIQIPLLSVVLRPFLDLNRIPVVFFGRDGSHPLQENGQQQPAAKRR